MIKTRKINIKKEKNIESEKKTRNFRGVVRLAPGTRQNGAIKFL